MIDLAKWTERLVQSVRSVCLQAKAPCVGYTVLFLDVTDEGDVYKFKTMLAGDPHRPIDPDEKQKIESALDYCSIYLEKVLNGHFDQEGSTH